VPSVDPSSTTTISTPPVTLLSAARMAVMVSAMRSASQYAGTTTENRTSPGAGARSGRGT